MKACIGEPVSWLRLERYGLGELRAAESRAVARHLAECAVCRACFARIETEVGFVPAIEHGFARRTPGVGWRARFGKWPLMAAGSFASAALVIWLALSPRVLDRMQAPVDVKRALGAKGAGIALELVRVDERGTQLEATRFAPGDRFKVLLTCAPSVPELDADASVVVFQDGQTFVPLAAHALAGCGNRRTLPGAFRLRGGVATVCVVLSGVRSMHDFGQVHAPDALPEPHVCVSLQPL